MRLSIVTVNRNNAAECDVFSVEIADFFINF